MNSVWHIVYVRIVDKGPGEILSFCKAWVWEAITEIVKTEVYCETKETEKEATHLMAAVVAEMEWARNEPAKICRLYLIGKAKRLRKGMWLWRPIANTQPVVAKQSLEAVLGENAGWCW